MDFIEGIGERYLAGKANAVPQQLENLAKKQFQGNAAPKTEPAAQDVGKNNEIESLRKQLAEYKLGEGKQEKNGPERSKSIGVSERKAPASRSPQRAASISNRSAKSNHGAHSHTKSEFAKHERSARKAQESPRRGRSESIKTAIAAKELKAQYNKFGGNHQTLSDSIRHSSEVPEPSHQSTPARNHRAATDSPASAGEMQYKATRNVTPKRPQSVTDVCIVEVIDEEPQRQWRRNASSRNVANVTVEETQRRQRPKASSGNMVELVEKDKNRTRYVIR